MAAHYHHIFNIIMEIPKIVKLANRLAESILMDWDKEEQIKLAWETASECNKIITEFHNKGEGVNMRNRFQS